MPQSSNVNRPRRHGVSNQGDSSDTLGLRRCGSHVGEATSAIKEVHVWTRAKDFLLLSLKTELHEADFTELLSQSSPGTQLLLFLLGIVSCVYFSAWIEEFLYV